MIGHFLADLFDRTMEVPDVGNRLINHFAVGFDHEAQHTMRARVLWPHADGHLFGENTGFGLSGLVHDYPIAAVFRQSALPQCLGYRILLPPRSLGEDGIRPYLRVELLLSGRWVPQK